MSHDIHGLNDDDRPALTPEGFSKFLFEMREDVARHDREYVDWLRRMAPDPADVSEDDDHDVASGRDQREVDDAR